MTSIRLMKRRHKNVLSRSRRKCRIILTRSYLRRILEVQKTRKNKTEKGGER